MWAQQLPHEHPARAEVTLRQTVSNPPPLGVNDLGDMGGTAYSRGNLIPDWGFEPVSLRFRYRVLDSGIENGHPWVTLDGRGLTRSELVGSGFLSGADYRVYRIVDAAGDPLPLLAEDDYLNLDSAARYERVDSGVVPAAGEAGFPDGGWVVESYSTPGSANLTRTSLTFTDASWLVDDRTYYYLVSAIHASGLETYDFADAASLLGAVEISAIPSTSAPASGPYIVPGGSGDHNDLPEANEGGWFEFSPRLVGGTGVVTWELLDALNQPMAAPAGLGFNPDTGWLGGVPESTPAPTFIRYRATADNGVVTRDFILNNPRWDGVPVETRPTPPQNIVATAGPGFVHLAWDPSPSDDVVGYRIYRSPVPLVQARERVYLAAGAPQPRRWDYIHFDKRTLAPDPAWSHPRVRTGHIIDTWRQWFDQGNITYQRVPHPVPPPQSMFMPGESCLSLTSDTATPQTINGPVIFHGVTGQGESAWYAYLEPGETYRYEAWLRQDGLVSGQVRLGFWGQYESIGQDFLVGGDWSLCRLEFTAPAVPTEGSHGGPALVFAGPGTVFMDSVRLVRVDDDNAVPGLEAPGPRNLQALQAFSPAEGPKGVLRNMWTSLTPHFMASILSLQPDSSVTYDWFQALGGGGSLPHHLQIAYNTGDSPDSRMKPWINVNANASIEEWQMLMEYLTAPIDPDDVADVAAKPWAHLRYRQRGVTTPWVDEFPGVVIEFSNETWHNKAVEEQWSGWSRTYYVNQGGCEFGLYVRHILDGIQATTPRLAQLRAEGRIAFQMGNNYGGEYVSEGIVFAPDVEAVGQATYINGRWETGDTPNTTFTDEGVQSTLLAHIENFAPELDTWRRQRERMADEHGILYDFYAYEGGPSGYTLPGTADDATVAIGELYGKSLAIGTSSLDAWLAAYEAGFREMAFFAFNARERWASHTPQTRNYPNGHNPHTGWLAVQLRNRHARGHMTAVEFPEAPTFTRDGRSFPLVGGYAFREGSRLAVFLLSRKLDGIHNGLDFGDGSTPHGVKASPVASMSAVRILTRLCSPRPCLVSAVLATHGFRSIGKRSRGRRLIGSATAQTAVL